MTVLDFLIGMTTCYCPFERGHSQELNNDNVYITIYDTEFNLLKNCTLENYLLVNDDYDCDTFIVKRFEFITFDNGAGLDLKMFVSRS